MRKLVVSTWLTLDGVFDADNMAIWYAPYDSPERQNYIREGILAADAILFGRKTYEMLAPYWSSLKNDEMGVAGKLNSVTRYVVSNTLDKVAWNNSSLIKRNVVAEINQLKQHAGTEIQVEGSATLVQSQVEAKLIDEYRFLVHPVMMGTGKRFFKEQMPPVNLELVSVRMLEKGVVLLCYKPG